jgi:hypothetical protein
LNITKAHEEDLCRAGLPDGIFSDKNISIYIYRYILEDIGKGNVGIFCGHV